MEIIEFANRLKRAMKENMHTAESLSNATDIPVASIRNWTSAHSTPRLDAVVKMADALNVSIDWLTGRKEEWK